MKDFTPENRLESIDEDELPSRQTKSKTNADIDYLLTFVDARTSEEDKPKLGRENKRQNLLSDENIKEYIKENSSRECESVEDRNNFITFIDIGLRLMNRVKQLMTKKKQEIKNGTKPSPLTLIQDLFFTTNNTESPIKINSNGKQTQHNSEEKESPEMRQFRTEREMDMLLHRIIDSQENKNQEKNETVRKYKYLLTVSLYERLDEKVTMSEEKQKIEKFINELEETLEKLNNIRNKNGNLIEQEKSKLIEESWTLIDQLSLTLSEN